MVIGFAVITLTTPVSLNIMKLGSDQRIQSQVPGNGYHAKSLVGWKDDLNLQD